MVAHQNAEVDWCQYFEKIRSVCPWSRSAWSANKIKIRKWNGEIERLNDLQAIVYLVNYNPRRLKKLADRLNTNDEIYEWLWSHPQGGGEHSTPQACLIQQDRHFLDSLRNRLNTLSN